MHFIVHTTETDNHTDQHLDGKTSIEIQKYNLTNIFEENSYLLQMKRAFEHQNDQLSIFIVQISSINFRFYVEFDVYRLHIKWFYDEFIVYATELPVESQLIILSIYNVK